MAVVLLGQCKTLAIISGGYLLFDARPNARTLLGAALAMVSIGAYTLISLSASSRPSGHGAATTHTAVDCSDGEPAEDVPLRGR